MKPRIFFKIIPIALALIAAAAIKEYKFIPSKATIKFKVITDKSEVEADGIISGLNGGIKMDSTNTKPISIDASVDVNTINSGVELRDESLKSADFFEVKKYPKITFASKDISTTTNGFSAKGNLTIKNKTNPITINFLQQPKGDTCIFAGTFSINRYEYHVGTKGDGVAKDVEIEFSLPVLKN